MPEAPATPSTTAGPGAVPATSNEQEPAPAQDEPSDIAPAETPAPSLDLLRAEPDGSVIIAGSAAPGTGVEIFAGDQVIGRVQTEKSGDWVFLPETPLPTGGVEITVADAATQTSSGQSVVVVIQPDRKSEPLVVTSTPGEASQVLQGLAPATEPPLRVAEVSPVAAPAPQAEPLPSAATQPGTPPVTNPQEQTQTPTTDSPATPEPEPALPQNAPAGDTPGAKGGAQPDTGVAPATDATVAVKPGQGTPDPAATQAGTAQPTAIEPGTGTPVADQPAPQVSEPAAATVATLAQPAPPPVTTAQPDAQTSVADQSAPQVSEPATAPADTSVQNEPRAAVVLAPQPDELAVQPPQSSPPETGSDSATEPLRVATAEPGIELATELPALEGSPAFPASIDAIEIDGERNFFAGGGQNGASVRLYVDNGFVAGSVVRDGRWLIESGPVLNPGSQRVRIDVLKPGTGQVTNRAEVNFVLEIPELREAAPAPDQTMKVAEAEPPATTPQPQPVAAGIDPAAPAAAVTAPAPVSAPVAKATPAPAPMSAPDGNVTPAPSTGEIPAPASQTPAPQPRPAQLETNPPVTPAETSEEQVTQPQTVTPAGAGAPVVAPPPGEPEPKITPANPQPAEPLSADASQSVITPPVAPTSGPTLAEPSGDPAPAMPVHPVAEAAPNRVTAGNGTGTTPAANTPVIAPAPVQPAPEVASATVAPATEPSGDQAGADGVSIRQEAPPVNAIPTLTATQAGDPQARRFTSGKAIIRPGDNLWTIAKRVYGQGLRFTTIYRANAGQIRDPHWIYPGQVFNLPGEDAVDQ